MFGHLKAEDFVNLMEGTEAPTVCQTHLQSCARCRELWESLNPLYASVNSLESEIPEPDWLEFRASVRDKLLSRSVQRDSVVRRWIGWSINPAVAWALSLLLAVGIPTGAFVWHLEREKAAASRATQTFPASALIEAAAEKGVFEDVIELSDSEQAQFQKLLQAAQTDTQRLQ